MLEVILLCIVVGGVFGATYSMLVYPLLVLGLARIRPRPWRQAPVDLPAVHIITVHNEERRIEAKLENALSLETPSGGLRTVVVDDGSDDRTAEIVARHAERGVMWIGCPRRGKEHAQIEAVRRTVEPLLVFSDASGILAPDAVRNLLQPFADSGVAAVSGTDRLREEEGGTGEGLYVSYEMKLREAESLVGSLVGLSGSLFALRREIAEGLHTGVPSDMSGALLSIRDGRRAVAQERAVCTYGGAKDVQREFSRKRRTALRGLRCLWHYRGSLVAGGPVTSWQVFSHKWMRFAAPWFAIIALLALVVAAVSGYAWARASLLLALAGLAGGAASLSTSRLRRFRLFRALGFFLVSSTAVLAAWIDWFSGHTRETWSPTRRP